jgi:nucleoid DNA-binding protein
MKMNIDNLALEIAGYSLDGELSQAQMKEVVRDIFEVLGENIADGHEVNIPNFGKFRRKETKARTGRNPKTGDTIDIPAKKTPNFLPAKQLKEAVNGS